MKQTILTVIAIIACFGIASATSPVDYVNPLVGSQSSHALSAGNTYPAVAVPWGMNFWTPVTGEMGNGWTYTYQSNTLRGFKQTHQPSPWINDYGQFSIMATSGEPVFDQNKRASWFSHMAEEAKPYYYKVYLASHNIHAEMTVTSRAAMMRFTMGNEGRNNIVIDAMDGGSMISVDKTNRRITGYTTKNSGGVPRNFKNYFVIELDHDIENVCGVENGYNDTLKLDKTECTGNHAGVVLVLNADRGESVNLRMASSFISPEQAVLNLKELKDGTFDEVKERSKAEWNEVLGRVEVEDDNLDHLRTFYSCLYRSVLFPRSLYEIDAQGNVMHYSPYNGKVLPGYMFTDTGFWDTFRSLFPLLNLIYPSMNEKMQQGLANAYRESGFLPEWASPGHRDCMVGNNSASVVADAIIQGVTTQDQETLWEAVTHGANSVHPRVSSTGRIGWEYYNSLGYVPCDVGINESAARTLEYAYDDWCIYQMGKAMGKPESEISIYKDRAQNYRNLFDTETKLMRGKKKDGSFAENFNPFKWGGDFTEGNSWHYTWSVFHDPDGLINLMGGNSQFAAMLDSVMTMAPLYDDSYYGFTIHEIREMQISGFGQYAHGNQPIQHMLYLYNYCGQPWKTQYWVREVMNRLYKATPDGYCGDEDNGQTSAWYVFSALGFYPVCPGSGQYVMGAPYYNKVKIRLENGKKLQINAKDVSDTDRFVQQYQVNGKVHNLNTIDIATLKKGATIDATMGNTPASYQKGESPIAPKKKRTYLFGK
ncbi:MAG: GH92 family glycosyl hydrolase [Muribaculaceae bacterium]|nr:GH92 family glycosyl hydrolase [Muribaculaceae bacterium]